MGVIEKAVAWAIEIANDPSHGYSQASRWGPDYDCSSFVIEAFEQAGIALREAGASYTGNMRGPMIACGFVDVTTQIGLGSGYGIQAGDVLLNYAAHTCLAIGNGKVANCRTDEGHPQSGDQGEEIRIQNYWNFPWNCVLRYKEKASGTVSGPDTGSSSQPAPRGVLRNGMQGEDVKQLQEKLNALGYDCGDPDGIYGTRTFRAVILFQEDHGLSVDGVAGRATSAAINEALANPSGSAPKEPAADHGQPFELPDLKLGDEGDAVTLLQAALNIRGYDCGKADGKLGPKTQAALNRFKEERGLKPDGTADRATWIKVLGVES